MTWDPSKPDASESPGLFPTQGQGNWARLEDLFEADHVFNSTASTNDGWHKVMRWVKQNPAPSANATAASTYAFDTTYKRSGADVTAPHLYHLPPTGTDTNIFPMSVAPIRAYVNFDGTNTSGSGAVQTIRSSFNVVQVTRSGTSTGTYIVEIAASALPTSGAGIIVTGMRSSSGEAFGFVEGSATYSDSVTTTSITIGFESSGGTRRNVTMGTVIVVGG